MGYFTLEQRVEMNRLRDDGLSLKVIAAHFGCSRALVSMYTRRSANRRISEDERIQMREMRARGAALAEVAKLFGRTPSQVSAITAQGRNPSQIDRMRSLRKGGMSGREIARQLSVDEAFVSRKTVGLVPQGQNYRRASRGCERPRIVRAVPNGRRICIRLWYSIRVLRTFTVSDLIAVAEVGNRRTTCAYLNTLRRAGFLTVRRCNPGHGDESTWRLVRNTGPQCPAILRRGAAVWDFNTSSEYPVLKGILAE